MQLPEEKVDVEVLKNGRWAQEPWLNQLVVAKGDKVNISIGIAYALQEKGRCLIITEGFVNAAKVAAKAAKIAAKAAAKADKSIEDEDTDNETTDNETTDNETTDTESKKKPSKHVKKKLEKNPAKRDKEAAEG